MRLTGAFQFTVQHFNSETLNLIALAQVMIAFKAHTAFHAGLDFRHFVFEPLKR